MRIGDLVKFSPKTWGGYDKDLISGLGVVVSRYYCVGKCYCEIKWSGLAPSLRTVAEEHLEVLSKGKV
tara:strand:- start:2538 stop:2741 length:204 start_codon:yes stop_codon:yes gene_type:complete